MNVHTAEATREKSIMKMVGTITITGKGIIQPSLTVVSMTMNSLENITKEQVDYLENSIQIKIRSIE